MTGHKKTPLFSLPLHSQKETNIIQIKSDLNIKKEIINVSILKINRIWKI